MNHAAPHPAADASLAKLARRNALLLTLAQAFNGSITSIALAIGALAGAQLLGEDQSLATVPISGLMVGMALGAMPAAALMRGIGRRAGFMTGSLVGMSGFLVCALAMAWSSFVLLTIGLTVAGVAGAFVQQYRFAAADAGDEAFRAKAISWVLAGGIASAIIGPQTVIATHATFAATPYLGTFVAGAVLAVVGMGILSLLGGTARDVLVGQGAAGGRGLGEIAKQPRFLVAVTCGVGSYALMTLLMTAAPLAMVEFHHGKTNSALGVQWHLIAMYAPSFFTGILIARFGKDLVICLGLVLLGVCAGIAIAGISLSNFFASLIILGVGWNFAFIGATAMLTETYRPEERAKVQGFNDAVVFGLVAVSSLISGKLFSSVGWEAMNAYAFPILVVCLAVVVAGKLLASTRASEPTR